MQLTPWVIVQIKAIEKSLLVLYKLVPATKSVDETLVCDHSNESYWVGLSYAVQIGSNFQVWGWITSATIRMNVIKQHLYVVFFIFYYLTKWNLRVFPPNIKFQGSQGVKGLKMNISEIQALNL